MLGCGNSRLSEEHGNSVGRAWCHPDAICPVCHNMPGMPLLSVSLGLGFLAGDVWRRLSQYHQYRPLHDRHQSNAREVPWQAWSLDFIWSGRMWLQLHVVPEWASGQTSAFHFHFQFSPRGKMRWISMAFGFHEVWHTSRWMDVPWSFLMPTSTWWLTRLLCSRMTLLTVIDTSFFLESLRVVAFWRKSTSIKIYVRKKKGSNGRLKSKASGSSSIFSTSLP